MPNTQRLVLVCLSVTAAAVGGAGLSWSRAGTPTDQRPAGDERRLTLFYTGEIHGTLEPCGCTSDPLGDIARYAALVREARARGASTLLVDAGGLLYGEGAASPREQPSNDLRARFLAAELKTMGLAAAGLGEPDLAGGVAQLQPGRLASNLGPHPAVLPAHVTTVGEIRVGLVGVADPTLGAKLGVTGEEPVRAVQRDIERLRREGAEIVVVLAPLDRPLARRLAREGGADFVVAGRQVGKGLGRAEKVGRGFLVAPADELQRVGRIDLVLRRGDSPLVDAGGPGAERIRVAEIDSALQRLDDDLARWAKAGGSGTAESSFVATKRAEREALANEQWELRKPWVPPATGSYFTNQLVAMNRDLPRDPMMGAAMRRLDAKIGAANLKRAEPPPPAEPGRAAYVGMAKCVSCHKSAATFWKGTVHAEAWQTLVAGGKSADYKCVGCHVTGYGQVGGSSLGHTRGLSDVQCETCHGPGSIHVAFKGLEEPSAVHRETPETTCLACHNEHHSDTFQYQAYMRDVLGPGHGASARAALGDGPTGHELRSAAMMKAKSAALDQASRMH